MNFKCIALLILLLNLPLANSLSAAYYADIEIDIGESGTAMISGTTNHEFLSPGIKDELTSKIGKYWLFKIDLNDTFADFVYAVRLPENASINYIKASGSIRIENESGRIVVRGTGRNEPLRITIQYSLNIAQKQNALILFALAACLLIALFVAGIFLLKKKQAAMLSEEAKKEKYGTLSERQLAIIIFLEKQNGIASQKAVAEALGIPKSSVSRNVEALIKKGYLRKEKKGMTNLLILTN